MRPEVLILIAEAITVYCLVLWTHSLRHKYGHVFFYALLGGITAIMSWVTDAGVVVEAADTTFMVGSTVFYTSLLLGVFVVYVFDGPRATRKAIFTVIGISILTPVLAWALHHQAGLTGAIPLDRIPTPSLRINAASAATTFIDLVFLAIAWELLGKPGFEIKLWLRAFLTLLGVMWLDVLLFATGAFAGTPAYLSIMKGTLTSRAIISVLALVFLYAYMAWQNRKEGVKIENRPVLAIFQRVAEMERELTRVQQEVVRRRRAERKLEQTVAQLEKALAEVKTLRGFLPICSVCKKIRDDQGEWNHIEIYIRDRSEAQFSHGICPDCADRHYPEHKLYRKP